MTASFALYNFKKNLRKFPPYINIVCWYTFEIDKENVEVHKSHWMWEMENLGILKLINLAFPPACVHQGPLGSVRQRFQDRQRGYNTMQAKGIQSFLCWVRFYITFNKQNKIYCNMQCNVRPFATPVKLPSS